MRSSVIAMQCRTGMRRVEFYQEHQGFLELEVCIPSFDFCKGKVLISKKPYRTRRRSRRILRHIHILLQLDHSTNERTSYYDFLIG